MPTPSSAGAHQQERYQQGLESWRRRVLPPLRWATIPVCLLGFAYLILGPATKVQFTAGLVVGGIFTLYLWVRDEPPEHVRRHREGAAGERATAKTLRPLLAAGWRVVHDVDTGKGNRDHVLVGPAGVFLLDSKKLGGTISVAGDVVRVERPDDERDSYELRKLAVSMRGEAARLSADVLAGAGVKTWVNAVVVFWSPFPARVVEGDNVAFVHGDELTAWLRRRPPRYDDHFVATVIEHVG